MLSVRPTTSLDEFAGWPGDPPNYRDSVASTWSQGLGRPEWSFVALEDGQPVGRVGYRVAPTVSTSERLGSLPASEAFMYGLWLPWDTDPTGVGVELVKASLASIASELPAALQHRINAEVLTHVPARRRLVQALPMTLFQEKEGFLWEDDGTPVVVPDRLTFPTIAETTPDVFTDILARVCSGTLDRNDRYYFSHMTPRHWAEEMMSYYEEEWSHTWLAGFTRIQQPVGFVAVSPFDEAGTATITYIGVVPEQRGHGYIDDLLAAGTAAAQRAGFRRMLSDVDTLNPPMLAAMERAGHHAAATPWHVWHYWGEVATIC